MGSRLKRKEAVNPCSMDANLLHISYEGDILEDPAAEPEESMWLLSVHQKQRRISQLTSI